MFSVELDLLSSLAVLSVFGWIGCIACHPGNTIFVLSFLGLGLLSSTGVLSVFGWIGCIACHPGNTIFVLSFLGSGLLSSTGVLSACSRLDWVPSMSFW